jgi:hypothetical protein
MDTMDTMYKKYINKYGNFSHILNIEIDESISEEEKNTILYDILNLINEKNITKHISNMDISLKWRVYDNTDLLHYYTDGNGVLGDVAIYEHTKILLNEIKKINNSDKFNIRLSKPLSKSICIM